MLKKCLLALGFLGCTLSAAPAPAPYGPVPTEQQVNWLRMEWYAFVHFGLNTYTCIRCSGDFTPDACPGCQNQP